MYLSFFGLNEKPFAITPDPRYLYLSERHAEALAYLLYGINEAGGFVQLTGEVGTGKTTIVRSLLAQAPKHAEIALILNPRMSAPEFLLTICEELGIGVPDAAESSVKDLVDILNRYLLRKHAEGRRVVLVVDEAQNLATDVLEQVRLLTNLETATQKLLQIILIGQPELRELLERNELRQLAQRVTGRYHLDPLSRDETAAYLRHRLRVAGATNDIFTRPALNEMYRLSGGVPRLINVIADRALLGAYTQDQHRVGATLVRRAASEVFGKRLWPLWLPWLFGATASLLAIAAVIGFWRTVGPGRATTGIATSQVAAVQEDVPAGAANSAVIAPQPPPAPPTVVELLAQFAPETDTDNAFNKLFALWGAQYVAGRVDPCNQATQKGLECLTRRGTLAELQRFNRPAILSLSDDAGNVHQVVLASLAGDRAVLSLGGEAREVGLGDLTRYWFGDYVLLWRPVGGMTRDFRFGMRGASVRQLRESLARVNGTSAPDDSDIYDADLAQQVVQFQRRYRLAADGIAGVQTLVMLDSVTAGNDTPMLVARSAQGG
ncbi:MAG: AAA family ATPase [Steroidobacteraceae bacterium]